MRIELGMENGESISIEIGDRTPDGKGYYIKLRNNRDIYTVDSTWYEVMERLVLDPPYPATEKK
jgi:hypothetical protein